MTVRELEIVALERLRRRYGEEVKPWKQKEAAYSTIAKANGVSPRLAAVNTLEDGTSSEGSSSATDRSRAPTVDGTEAARLEQEKARAADEAAALRAIEEEAPKVKAAPETGDTIQAPQ
eukprot:5076443-Prymnesium_polylepis.1